MAQPQQRYKVLERIAAGGMAEVYRAESAGLEGFKKTVAIKRVLPHLSEKKQFIGMFLDEARLSAHLSHSNCVQVFDIGVGDNTYFIVMEFVDGSDLKAIIEQHRKHSRPVPTEESALICVRICEGLSYAHELTDGKGTSLNIVHRDMSPPNVLLTRFGEVKIVDFGLAKANSQLEKSEPGIIKGKFSYLSPEAALGNPVDARTDVFAVGIILWELLAGRRLFLGETDLETVRQVQTATVPAIRQINPRVPVELERVLSRALARDPAERYQTARELGQDLNNLLFKLGRAVSSFDIAKLVEPIWRDRLRKRAAKPEKGGAFVIGSLIDEALFEFSSLRGKDVAAAQQTTEGSTALNLAAFENVQDWAGDLGDLGDLSDRMKPSSDAPSLGNLAALEEDTSPRGDSDGRAVPISARHPTSSNPAPQTSSAPPAPQKSGKGGLITLVLLILVVAGVAGAYFGGALPH